MAPVARPRIGVMVDLIVRLGREVASGVATYAHAVNWEMLLRPIWRVTDARMSGLFDADGWILAVYNDDILKEVLRRKKPVVNIASMLTPTQLPSVLLDHRAIGQMAASHLLDVGVKTLVVDLPPLDANAYWVRERTEAFVSAADRANVPVHIYNSTDSSELSRRLIVTRRTRWMIQLPRPIGIFACNDQHALEVMNECYEAGLKIPQDVAVLGCDNDELINRFALSTLSSISVDFVKQGYLAAELLDRQMHHREMPFKDSIIRVPPVGVIQRESTQILLVSDPEVTSAIKYIIANQHRLISVNDVVNATNVSRRTLEERFRKVRRRTILQEILMIKIERAKRLLSETDLKMSQIAAACGFGSRVRFFTAFRQYAGMTPQKWRSQNVSR